MIVFEPHKLDQKKRCCGRRPLPYRTPHIHFFCFRCDTEFDTDGNQKENYLWIKVGDGFTPRYPNQGYVKQALTNRKILEENSLPGIG